MLIRVLPLLVLLVACKEDPKITGQVVDVWGNPIAEATVMVDGLEEFPTTDEYGNFSLPMQEGTLKLKAGRDGYIQEHLEVEIEAGGEPPNPVLKLFPKPEEKGFYIVGKGEYAKLDDVKVYGMGTELASITGMKSVETRVEADPFRVIYHTDLRMDEIVRMGLELHKLEYKKSAEVQGTLGATEVEVNLWVSAGELEIEFNPMRSKDAYLVTVPETLAPGMYAFHTQDLLDPKEPGEFDAIPEALRVAFPFELR